MATDSGKKSYIMPVLLVSSLILNGVLGYFLYANMSSTKPILSTDTPTTK